jgi:putative ABC transport system substrate-binding protein
MIRALVLVAALGFSTLLAPCPTVAQQSQKIPRVGILAMSPGAAPALQVEGLRQGLRELGWIERQNIIVEYRWAENVDRLPELAADLVRLKVDVIFAASSIEVEPARQATKTIPIVFAAHGDPVGAGHVASLARPGGNITGIAGVMTELAAKELELLKAAVPHVTRFGVLWDPTTPSHPPALKSVQAAAEKLAVQVYMVPARTVDDIEGAFSAMIRERVGAFVVLASVNFQRARLAEVALKHRLPGMFFFKGSVEAGNLMSYGPDLTDMGRRSAAYIDKILKGAKPADLPVEQMSKYELFINLKTAKALGLTIPPTILIRADKLIE